MEAECDSREQSEDDSSPTDTSEDSVEVKVNRIYLPGSHPRSNINPINIRPEHSSSAKIYEPLDFSLNRNSIGPSISEVAEELPSKNNYGSTDIRDRKHSRRKGTDPRRLLANEKKHDKRSFDKSSDDGPPPKLWKHNEKDFDSAEPSTSFQTPNLSTEPPTFPPLFLSPFHPMLGYPYSAHVVNNIVPHLNFLTQELYHVPYSIMPNLSPSLSTIDRSYLSTQASPHLPDTISRSLHLKKDNSVSPKTKGDVTKELSEVKIIKELESKQQNKIPSVVNRKDADKVQERPLDYSLKKYQCYPISPTSQSLTVSGELKNIVDSYCGKSKHRNYKNMTRARRVEANARERTRVHTISAAFEKLRQSVPCYSNNQKLSKLSVLRIACSYILSLSRLTGLDYSSDNSNPTFENCVDLTTKTIHTEGKTKKRRDD